MKQKPVWAILLLIFLGCKKDNPGHTKIVTLKGELILSRSRFTTFDPGKNEKFYQYAKAIFVDSFYAKDAGTVRYGDSSLHQQDFTFLYYSYNPDSILAGFTPAFDGGQDWHISGNATNEIPDFSTAAPKFPSFLAKNFDTLPVISKSLPYTISWDASVPCDSITIGIYQSHNAVISKVAGNISSFTFLPTQLSIFETFFSTSDNAIIIEGESYKNIVTSGILVTVKTYARRNCSVKIVN